MFLHDKIFIKGISSVRSQNDTNADYIADKHLESIGIRSYIHKFHLGLQPYYFKLAFEKDFEKMTEEEVKKDPQAYYTRMMTLKQEIHNQRKRMTDNSFRMVLRCTMMLTDRSIGQLNCELEPEYTGNHIAVFECALKTPPSLQMIDHTHRDYVVGHRMNFKNWKLVDIDNWMKGNPYFDKFMTQEGFKAQLNRVIGPKDHLNVDIKAQSAIQRLRKMSEKALVFDGLKEP